MAHKGHHCIRMLNMTLARALFAVSRALFVSRMFYSTFRVLYLQFACSICSSHVLFNIPRALFVARMVYSPFRVLHLQLACSILHSACSICNSRALFVARMLYSPFRMLHLQLACSSFFLRVLFMLAFPFAARALDRVIRALCFFSRVPVHVTLSPLTCMACWKQHGGPRGRTSG